jgi:chaperone modulatory protein CbpM
LIRVETLILRDPRLTAPMIADWVGRGWVEPEGVSAADWAFTEVSVRRLHLLWDLRVDLALDEEAVPVVLSLLDQLHVLRGALQVVIAELDGVPDDVRARLGARIGAMLDHAP